MHDAPAVRRPSRPRLLVLDVDGTLTNSRHEVSDATRRAVARIRAAGIRVMLATGRRYRDAIPVAESLGITEPIVTASGALVKRPGDHATLFQAEFGPGVLPAVLTMLVAAGHEPVLYSDSFALGFDFHCRRLGGEGQGGEHAQGDGGRGLDEYFDRNRSLANVVPNLHLSPPAGVFAGFTMGTHDGMLALERSLDDAFPGRLSLHTIRSPRYRDWMCEIAPAGVTKWSGILALAAGWRIDPAEICAVGDDVNDLPMIRGAGRGIAMGNARPEVQAAADTVVGSHDEDGLADVADLLLTAGPGEPEPSGAFP
jgi:hydroxymethylpyrimidine pyrophosphatase-like HAD family hydrolase